MTSKARRAKGGPTKKRENESNLRRVERHRGKRGPVGKCVVKGCGKTTQTVEHHKSGGGYETLCKKHHAAREEKS